MTLSNTDLIDSAFLSEEAYQTDENRLRQKLAANGWELWDYHTQLTGTLLFGQAAGFIAVKNGVMSLIIRGSDGFLAPDWLDATLQTAHYLALKTLIDNAIHFSSYTTIHEVLIAGHSIGAAMAERISALEGDKFNSKPVTTVTFGSPGVVAVRTSASAANETFSFFHTEDPVAVDASVVAGGKFFGSKISIDLPDIAAGLLHIAKFVTEHRMQIYVDSAHAIASERFKYNSDLLSYSFVIGTDPSKSNLFGGAGPSVIIGDSKPDFMSGERHVRDDYLRGLGAGDILDGGGGADKLYGGSGDDKLDGGSGADILSGDLGNDRLYGGGGNDIYSFEISFSYGNDLIADSAGLGGGSDTILIYGGSLIANRSQIKIDRDNHDLRIVIETPGSVASWETITIKDMDVAPVETLKVVGVDNISVQFSIDLLAEFNAQASTTSPPVAAAAVVAPPSGNGIAVGSPHVTPQSQLILAGTSIAASFLAVTAADVPIVRYEITDQPGKGYFLLNGSPEPQGTVFQVSASDFTSGALQYVAGTGGDLEKITIKALDAAGRSGTADVLTLAYSAGSGVVSNAQGVVAHDDLVTMTAGTQTVVRVLDNDTGNNLRITDLTGNGLAYAGIKPTTQDAIIVAPPSGFVGTYNLVYTVTDGAGHSSAATLTVNVAAPVIVSNNHAPVAPDLHTSVNVGNALDYGPRSFVYDPDGDAISVVGFGNGLHGQVSRVGDGLHYVAATGFTGDDQISYTIADSHGAQSSGTIAINVHQPMTAVNDFITTDPNIAASFNVLANDINPGGGALSLLNTGFGPSHGSIITHADGSVTYTPVTGYTGIDSFNYTAADGLGGTSVGTATLAVGTTGVFVGGSGDDILVGNASDNLLQGNDGNDTLTGGAGTDVVDGGTGFDYADFSAAPGPTNITIRLPAVAGDGTIRWDQVLSDDGFGGKDSLRNIEGVIGSNHRDVIEGNVFDNVIYGNGGDDLIQGLFGNDTVYGGEGNDDIQTATTVYGGAGNDSLVGGANNDLLDGGSGDDFIYGLGGNDTLRGGDGNDSINGSGLIEGGAGNDTLRAVYGTATLVGGAGDDLIVGSAGDDVLQGGDGNDRLVGNGGNDTIDGGAGLDTVDMRDFQSSVFVDLAAGFARTPNSYLLLKSVEVVYGEGFAADMIYGSNADDTLIAVGNAPGVGDTLVGRGGNDTLLGAGSDDTLEGGAGADTLTGGVGSDRFVYRSVLESGDTITDFASGVAGDILVVSYLLSTAGYSGTTPFADKILRLVASGNDTLIQVDPDGRSGAEGFKTLATLKGVNAATLTASNFDVADAPTVFASSTTPAAISLSNLVISENSPTGTGVGAIIQNDGSPSDMASYALVNDAGGRFSIADGNILVVANASLVDYERGSAQSIAIRETDASGDTFVKNFVVSIQDGVDTFMGTMAHDVLKGTAGDDVIFALAGNDTIVATSGADYVDGGDGQDSLDFSGAIFAVQANLKLGQTHSGQATDALSGIENLIGSKLNDVLTGNDGTNVLCGGKGRDLLTGGVGKDVFDFNAITETGKSATTRDVIADFIHGTDKIDLSTIDAKSKVTGNQAFHFIGTSVFHHLAGELHYSKINKPGSTHDMTLVEGDVNGDGLADFQIQLTGLKTLLKGDFVL